MSLQRKYSVIVNPSDASPIVEWSSSDTSLATIDPNTGVATFINQKPEYFVNNWKTGNIGSGEYKTICWSPELGIFCTVGYQSTMAYTSTDGLSWAQHRLPSNSQYWTSVCWSPELKLFCAVASYNNSTNIAATSPDGITWTQRTMPTNNNWWSVCWSPELGLFCAVSDSSAIAATSPDGITWTQRTLPTSTNWISICWSSELGIFCVIAYNSAMAATSSDGITWTQRSLPVSGWWSSICWSPELGIFCAVASHDSNIAATSPDGITWTQRTLPVNVYWNSICWSPELRLFCVVSGNYSNIVATSSDGITWTQKNSLPFMSYWYSICWSSELGLFCTVTPNDPYTSVSKSLKNYASVKFTATTTDGTNLSGSTKDIMLSAVYAIKYNSYDIWDGTIGNVPTPVNDVYTIKTGKELAAIAAGINAGTLTTLGKTFILNNDIDLNNNPWTPIGTSTNVFTGIFNGAGHNIKNLYIKINVLSVGFIGYSDLCTVKNLYINGNITSIYDANTTYSANGNGIGGVIGYANSSKIFNCIFNGNISYNNSYSFNGGGIVGCIKNSNISTITNCYANTNITGTILYIGGISGNSEAIISNCYSVCTANSSREISPIFSGISGTNGIIKNCCVQMRSSTISNKYSIGMSATILDGCYTYGSNFSNEQGTIVDSVANLPVSTILLDRYENIGEFYTTATAYPKESSQATNIAITASTGLEVNPSTIVNDTATELLTNDIEGTLTFALPASVTSTATHNCSPSVTMKISV